MSRTCLTVLAVSFLCVAFHASVATADDHSEALAAATNKYRSAVVDFETQLGRVRGIRNADRALVDRFERATRRLALAAKNPRHLTRLQGEWKRVEPLQQQVQSAIFQKYTLNRSLLRSWEIVLYYEFVLRGELVLRGENPNVRDLNRVRLLPTRAADPFANQSFSPIGTPPTVLPIAPQPISGNDVFEIVIPAP